MNFENLPFGMTGDDLIVIMAALAAVLTTVALWSALVPRDTVSARARDLVERRAALKADATAPRRRRQNVQAVGMMRKVVSKLNLMRGGHAEGLSITLARAGHRSKDAAIFFMFARFFLPMVTAGLAAFMIYVGEVYQTENEMMKVALVLGSGLAGAYLPTLYIRNQTEKRREQLLKALPDGIDLMVICAEAGLSLDASLQRVSKELSRSWPELADEFALTAVEIGFLPDRRQALDNLAQRTNLPGIKAMVSTLIQTERYGTPLADSMRVLANELRHERMMRAEEKAARLPATLTVPMILFILLPLFVVLIGPAIISVGDGLGSF